MNLQSTDFELFGVPAQFAQAAGQLQGGAEEKTIGRIEGIINSMTPLERVKPELLKASRKRRIAAGAGVTVQEVNRLLNQFEQTQKVMKQFSKGGMNKMMRAMKGMMPGMGQYKEALGAIDEREIDRIEAIIYSMTPGERA